jgi:uncharacterized protein (TIGR01777 family)
MKNKKVLIIGASGFIGSSLLQILSDSRIEICKGRDIVKMNKEDIHEMIKRNEVIINLAGYPVTGPWSKKKKKLILDSRISTSKRIVNAIIETGHETHLINASAIGLYKPDKETDEFSYESGDGFLAEVVSKWEEEIKKLEKTSSDYTLLRIGVVLGKGGGAYSVLRKLTKFNLGTYFSGGKQKVSFILLEDAVRAIKFVVDNRITGPVNLTAPKSTDYKEFMTYLKQKTGAFLVWNMPSFILKLMLGKSSSMLLDSQDVKPAVLLKNNFNFIASDIESCIDNIESN